MPDLAITRQANRVDPNHRTSRPKPGATEQRDPMRLSQGTAPLLTAVVLETAASAKQHSAPAGAATRLARGTNRELSRRSAAVRSVKEPPTEMTAKGVIQHSAADAGCCIQVAAVVSARDRFHLPAVPPYASASATFRCLGERRLGPIRHDAFAGRSAVGLAPAMRREQPPHHIVLARSNFGKHSLRQVAHGFPAVCAVAMNARRRV